MQARMSHASLAIVVATIACGSTYSYAPEGATFSVEGTLTTRIGIPPEQPRGDVRVESGGTRTIESGPQRGTKALHVRMTISNDAGHGPWTFDVRDQLIDLPGIGKVRPLAATAPYQAMPIVVVPVRDKRVVDIYYPVARPVDAFDLLWQVHTSERVVAERTPFGRVELEPELDESSTLYASGEVWWQDPWYSTWDGRRAQGDPLVIRRH
jgi:hypothetical protein